MLYIEPCYTILFNKSKYGFERLLMLPAAPHIESTYKTTKHINNFTV